MKHSFNIKKISSLAMLTLALAGVGCNKQFLDVPPQGEQPADVFWVDAEDASMAVNAMYANLRSWNQTAFAAIAVESIGSDEAEKGSSATDATFFNNLDDFTHTSTEGQIKSFWEGQYQNINLCNQVLDNVPAITMDETLKNRYFAEAKFVRAYSYFRLVRAFGDVPLRLTLPAGSEEYNIPRTAKAEVWAAIEKDLTEAATVLPQTYPASDIGRATKGAALGLLAKVSMYQKKWPEVLSLTNQVMGMGYELFPNFYQLFRIPNENSKESLFEIQAQSLPAIQDASSSQYSQVQGARGVNWGGWGFNVPTQELVDAFEDGDPRSVATIFTRGETTPEGDFLPLVGDNPYYNKKVYVPSSYRNPAISEGADQNVRVLRYADILLMNAEASNELDNPTQALTSLNAVRARARAGNNSILPDVTVTEKEALRRAIWHERRVELAMEFDRFFDVIRQGRGKEVFGPKGFQEGKNEVMPIPSDEIDLSGGLLTQNPGY